MIRYIARYRFYISIFLLLLIPILSIDTMGKKTQEYRFLDKIIIGISAPIQTILSWFLEITFHGCQRYLFLLNTYTLNQELLKQNQKLLNEIGELRETKQENNRLKALLNFQETLKMKTLAARVIAKDFFSDFRIIRITHGPNTGIERNMAVINQKGVIGRILKTTSTVSDVITIVDILSAVDIIVERSRAHGILEGFTGDLCELKYVIRTDDINVGDTLITSGLGGFFPKGLPVGTVTQVDKKPYGMNQKVQVAPAVDFDQLEEVLVLLTPDPDGDIS